VLVSGRGEEADDDIDIRIVLFERRDNRLGLFEFPHRGRVKPDSPRRGKPSQAGLEPAEECATAPQRFSDFRVERKAHPEEQPKHRDDDAVIEEIPKLLHCGSCRGADSNGPGAE